MVFNSQQALRQLLCFSVVENCLESIMKSLLQSAMILLTSHNTFSGAQSCKPSCVMTGFFTVMNLIHIQYNSTSQVHIQYCTSFNIVCQTEASPCKIASARSSFLISGAVASQLHLNLSNVLKLQGLTKCKCSAGSQE